MRHHTTAATAGLLLAAAAVTACSSSSHTKTTPTTPPASSSPRFAAAAPTKLSTTWVPKLQALADGPGVHACATDSGSDDCVTAIGDLVTVYGNIAAAINTAGEQATYPKTLAEVSKLVGAANTYDKDECAGDPHADVDGSPCPKAADTVTVGASTLQLVMQTDEVNAG